MRAPTIETTTVSHGWLEACRVLLGDGGMARNHLFIRMSDPLPEDLALRAAADRFAIEADVQPIDEVRNTIFPAALAEDLDDPKELTAEYIDIYPLLKGLGKGSHKGTYFGRICAYPRGDRAAPANQLVQTIGKLRAAKSGTTWKSIYELNIYSELKDRELTRGFPCMSHLAFHVHEDRLDCLATYRSHDVVAKGYGNYLGIAELQSYVAKCAGFRPGELAVLAGRAFIELSLARSATLRDLIATRD